MAKGKYFRLHFNSSTNLKESSRVVVEQHVEEYPYFNSSAGVGPLLNSNLCVQRWVQRRCGKRAGGWGEGF